MGSSERRWIHPRRAGFRCLSRRRFPTTLTVRSRAQLDRFPEPDVFHDVFGRVPLHSDPAFADSDAETMAMARLFWFTVSSY